MAGKLWGGRFDGDMAESMAAYTASHLVDRRMIAEDIWGSQAHAVMLRRCEILEVEDLRVILTWLEQARTDLEAGSFELRPELEDVHMNVERYLLDNAGAEFGGKLHTARSRNDQVLCDAKLYLRARLLEIEAGLVRLCRTMLHLAEGHLQTILPGYTHSQHAQPITLAYWATAHVSLWLRDLRRLRQVYPLVNSSPLGACAIAGTDLPIRREVTAELLGFDSVHEHALDVTSSRDFLLESLAGLTILMVHLSRLAEELVWWSSYELSLIELDDAYTSGSSIMPQKKNPDVAELTRGKAARVIGDLTTLLVVLKSLPMGYSRDLQEDKPPVWDALDQVLGALPALDGALATMTVNADRMRELVDANFATATQLANGLVRDHGLPFRQAHEVVGGIVGALVSEGRNLTATERVVELLADAGIETGTEAVAALLDPAAGVARQNSLGGAAPDETRRMMAGFAAQLGEAEVAVIERCRRIEAAKASLREVVRQVLA